ncbi:Arsenite methyltransferase [Leucoagaricus sp. SymC.cos]|nr:Arsenite methyltransferase [Leucoagaricus sp. SymC.cos]
MSISKGLVSLVNEVYSERAHASPDIACSTVVASSAGYTQEQLATLPVGANLGMSCGNPVSSARLRKGEAVLDLGSGGGIDVFLAADLVGSNGVVVGLDASKDMIDLARQNAKVKGVRPPHIAFAHASLTDDLPIESNSVDCILSNCVLNLLPVAAKASVLKEAFRVLKPGGRINLADVVAIREMPPHIKTDMTHYVNCVSGAVTPEEYKGFLMDAGFDEISLIDTGKDLTACSGPPQERQSAPGEQCCTQPPAASAVKSNLNFREYAASYQVSASKPCKPASPVSATVLKNWWYGYPEVKSTPTSLAADDVATLIRDPTKSNKDFTVIDVRRNDHAGGHVRGSHQCPAQTFYDNAPGYFDKFKDSEEVIFYCQSSNGQGPRCAGWYQDYLNSIGYTSSKAYVLAGGIKGWMSKYKGEDDLVDYD